MRYHDSIIFKDWEEVSAEVGKTLKLYGIKESSFFKNAHGKLELAIIGKVPAPVQKLINLGSGEVLGDYEGVDDVSKKTGYVFPVEKCKDLLIDIFKWDGRFVEIPSEEQDPISGEVLKEVHYIKRAGTSEAKDDLLSEHAEAGMYMVNFSEDDKETIAETFVETLNNILEVIGNKNLQEELNKKFISEL